MNRTAIEDKELGRLEQMIRDTPAEIDLTRGVMDRYDQKRRQVSWEAASGRRGWRKPAAAVAAAVLIMTAVAGTGLISPAAAEALKHIPGMERVFQLAGDLGLRAADEQGLYSDPGVSDTQGGVSVAATAVAFDGIRVSVGLERTAPASGAAGQNGSLQEAMTDVELSINGLPLNDYAPYGSSIGPFLFPVPDSDKLVLEFSDLRNQGGQAFPEQFELGLQFRVTGIEEPFLLDIPVELNTRDNLVLAPSVVRHSGNVTMQVDKVELTPVTTNITTRLELDGMTISEMHSSGGSIGYELFDDQGNIIQMLSGNGTNASGGNVLVEDSRFAPLGSVPQSITLKPYHFVYKEGSTSEFQLDARGNVRVEYIPELEVTVPVAAAK
ncbi:MULTISPECIES: DUF4179 domain-containing protein [unclassified Paenibacillus]|uniref:DUF4179 domain-containing protein n=1 Tax=unclassified Paenibacillus TaxID=185978 RepID=UPI0024050893|nr:MULTISPECIES: DUF4179 domain-containing protein [unclassified Paenibacillus]